MDKDQAFLKKASELLDLNKWGDFLLKWANTLDTYGTSKDSVHSTEYKKIHVEFNGREFPAIYFFNPDHSKRKKLMAKQEHYVPFDKPESYGLRLSLDDCLLCENIVQGIDAQNHPDKITNNIMIDLGNYIILPNRYPHGLGQSLFMEKNHDDTTHRVAPRTDLENKTEIYLPEKGKTRGNIITEDYLETVIKESDKLHLSLLRNHFLDGMSIPSHDHFHLIPEDLPVVSLIEYIVNGKEKTDYSVNIHTSNNSPFDTLIISEEEGKNLVKTAQPILERLEKEGEVFTLAYGNKNLLITPRNKEEVNNRRITTTAVAPILCFGDYSQKSIDPINKYLPANGEFNWDKFIP